MNIIESIVSWDRQALLFFYRLNEIYPQMNFLFKFLAVALVYIAPIIFIIGYFWSKSAKRVMIMATVAGLFAWQVVGTLSGAVYFRQRPFANSAVDIKEIVFHRPTYSFPSDHALFFASIVVIFWLYGYRKLAIVTAALGIINSLMRVTIGIHYPLDIAAGWFLGALAASLIFWQRKFIEKYVAEPVERVIFKLIKH